MTSRIFFFLFLTGLSSLSSINAQTLAGTVLDPSGATVPMARVRAYALGQSTPFETTANASGYFKFDVPASSEYLLSAETQSLATAEPLRLTVPAQNLTLRVVPGAQRASVSVTADGIPTSLDDSGKAFDILDRESLSRRNEIFLLESLRLTPGLQVQQTGGPGAIARIVTRGLRTADTSVLIDGFRYRDTTSTQGDAGGLLSDLMLVNADRFEVCRGNESTLYGTHATGGAINIVTDSGGGPFHGQIDFEGGGLGLLRSLAKASGGKGKFQWTGAVNHLNVLNGIDGNDRYRNTGTQAFARYALTPKTSLSGRFFSTEAFSQYNTAPGAKAIASTTPGIVPGTLDYYNPQVNDPDARRATRTLMGLIGVDHQLTSKLSVRVQYNRLYSNRYDANGPAGSGFQAAFRDYSQFGGSLDTVNARATWNWLPRQTLLAGYEFEREYFYNLGDDSNPDPARRSRRQVGIVQRAQSAYLQQQFRFGQWLINASGRIQNYSLKQPDFFGAGSFYSKGDLSSPPRAYTGDLSIAYLIPKTGTKLRTHLGRGYRAPSLYERFGTSLFSGRYSIYGDPNLKPDRTLSLDFGIDQYLLGNKARLSATYFYTRLHEIIGFGPVPREPYGRSSGYYNTGGGIARGLETSATLQLTSKWSVQTAYTITSTLDARSIYLTGQLQTQRVYPHTGSITTTYFLTPRLDVSLDFFAASDYLVPFFSSLNGSFGSRAFLFPGPRKADLAARYRIPLTDRHGLELFTRLENINNQTYYEAGYQTPGFWGTTGLRWRF